MTLNSLGKLRYSVKCLSLVSYMASEAMCSFAVFDADGVQHAGLGIDGITPGATLDVIVFADADLGQIEHAARAGVGALQLAEAGGRQALIAAYLSQGVTFIP